MTFRRPSERTRYRASRLRPLDSMPQRDADEERGRILPFGRTVPPAPSDDAPRREPAAD